MIEVIIIICLSIIFVIFLRRLPQVEAETAKMKIVSFPQALPSEVADEERNQKIAQFLNQADETLAQKKYLLAEKLYIKIATLDPTNPKVYGKLGQIYIEKKNFLDAKEAFSEAAKRDPTNSLWYNNLGLALYNLGQFNESIEAYQKSIEIDDTIAHRFVNLGLAYQAIGDFKNAKKSFEKAVILEPNNENYKNFLEGMTKKLK